MKRAMTEHDFASQTSGWQQRVKPYFCYTNFGTKVLAIGIASSLATFAPLQAEATIQTVTQEVSLTQPLDVNADGIPDLLCMAGEDTDTDNWTNTSYLYCHTFGGARLWSNTDGCLPISTTDVTQIQQLSAGGSWQAVCELSAAVDNGESEIGGSTGGPSPKTLGIITSGKNYGWLKIMVNAANTDAKTVMWSYGESAIPGGSGATPGTNDPITNLTAGVDNGQISLTWDNKSESGTSRLKILRDDQLIAETLANATFYTDGQLPPPCDVPHTYTVQVINAWGSISQTATVRVTSPCTETPPSRLFIKVDGQCAGHVTTTPDVGINCAASDCQQIRTPKDDFWVPNCKPAKCSASLKNIGETITLHPQPDSTGCVFSSWGGNEDCANGELVVTANNKMCIAFFQPAPPSAREGSRVPPPPSSITPPLPNLGKGMAIAPDGQNSTNSVQFDGGISVNGGNYQPVVTATTSDLLKIRGMIRLDSQHLTLMTMNIFLHMSYQATGQSESSSLMVDESGNILSWDKNPAHLVLFRTVTPSTDGLLELKIFQGKMSDSGLGSGNVAMTFGYQLENGGIVWSPQPMVINVVK